MDTNSVTLKAADGTPLKKKLQQSLFQSRLRAFGLVSPLLIFLIVLFVLPILLLLWQGVYDTRFSNLMPETSLALKDWDGKSEPSEEMYAALVKDLVNASSEFNVLEDEIISTIASEKFSEELVAIKLKYLVLNIKIWNMML